MIARTKPEIEKFAQELWKGSEICVTVYGREHIEIDIPNVGLRFDDLCKVSEFFGTRNINEVAYHVGGGCVTCDYSEETGICLEIRP